MSGNFRKGRKSLVITVISAVFLFTGLFGEASGGGLKYFTNYTQDDYGLQPQNWSITQDKLGIIYAGNVSGLLQYDGVSWHSIPVPNDSVLSLAADASGTIYVGGINELGYLSSNTGGQPAYRSLLENLDKNKRDFGYVWRTHATAEGIYFRTGKYVFRWHPREQQMVVELELGEGEEYRLNGSYYCGGKYFIKQVNAGLMCKGKKSFTVIPGGETFSSTKTVFMIVPYDAAGEKLLIGTREEGFFLHDGKTVTHFPTEIENYLREKKANHGIKLSRSPGHLAIATLRGGLVIIDLRGRLQYLFSKETGLLDDNVKYVFEDAQGNVWAALNKGITKLEYSSPFSIYDDRHSRLPGFVYSAARQTGRLVAGTSEGLFYIDENMRTFTPVKDMSSACWSLLAAGDSLLAATDTGVFRLKGGITRRITAAPAYVLVQSAKDANRVWVGMRSTLASIYREDRQPGVEWVEERRYNKVDREIRTIVEDREGHLWLGAVPASIFRVIFPDRRSLEKYRVTRYNGSHHLPEGDVQVFWAAGHVLFGTKKELLRFDDQKNVFVPDDTLGKKYSSWHDVYRMFEDKEKTIWFHARGRNYRAILKQDRTYEIQRESLARIPVSWQVNAIFPDPQQDVTWFGTNEGLICFDSGFKKKYDCEYNTIIRRVLVNGNPRFYDYMGPKTRDIKKETGGGIPTLKYNERNIRFEFAAPFFEAEKRTIYLCKLEHYDKDWRSLQGESFKDYTHLDAGLHTFRAKAENIYGNTGSEAMFRFRVLSPWYMTWWAYLLYTVLFSFLLFLLFQWRLAQSKREKKRLEQIVNKRTKEINRKNLQMEKQTTLLREQAVKLKELDHAKSLFFTNISHEFRTPLTLIIGPLEQMLSGDPPVGIKEKLDMMHRNSQRLQTLINRLLDLSRIDSGKMKLKASPQDIVSFLKGITAIFEQLIRLNKLALDFHSPADSIILYFDAEKLDEVFCNLLTNAIKFTPEKGKITVTIRETPGEEDFPAGAVEVSIEDTGIGIPKEQLAHIFDRFFQVESHERKHKGSGIGLALTRELVTLHHGKIDVNSRVGENSGTEFILRFPLGKAHLEPGEIAALLETGTLSGRREKQWPFHNREVEVEFANEDEDEVQETGKSTILVVEDNPDMRRFIRESIESQYTVMEAEHGREGILKARKFMPDLIISDIMMPEVDGYELCQTLKKDIKTSHIPIVFLTAKASEGDKVEGLETGADDYIIKPFNARILETRIKNLIDLRRQLQEKFQRQMVLQPTEIQVSTTDQRFLEKLQKIIEEHLDDTELNVESLSKKMAVSRVTLNRKILAFTGETATDFIRSYRLKRALQLLKENFGTVLEVSAEVGFSSSAYFTKCFREKFHQLPSAFLGKPPEEEASSN